MKTIETPHWVIKFDHVGVLFENVSDQHNSAAGSWPSMIELAIAILQNAPGASDPAVRPRFYGGAPKVYASGELLTVEGAQGRAMAILRACREADELHEQIGGKP